MMKFANMNTIFLAVLLAFGNCAIPLSAERTARSSVKRFMKKNVLSYNLRDFSDIPVTEDISVIVLPDLHKGNFQHHFDEFLRKEFSEAEVKLEKFNPLAGCHTEIYLLHRVNDTEYEWSSVFGLLTGGLLWPIIPIQKFKLSFTVYKNGEKHKEYEYPATVKSAVGFLTVFAFPFSDDWKDAYEASYSDSISDFKEKIIKDCSYE